MKIEELLREGTRDARLTLGRAWLYWDLDACYWVVMVQPYRRSSRVYATRYSEDEAVDALITASEE